MSKPVLDLEEYRAVVKNDKGFKVVQIVNKQNVALTETDLEQLATEVPKCFTEYGNVNIKGYYCNIMKFLNPTYRELTNESKCSNNARICFGDCDTVFVRTRKQFFPWKLFLCYETKRTMVASCLVECDKWNETDVYEIHEVCIIKKGVGICSTFVPKVVSCLLNTTTSAIVKIYCMNNNPAACCCYRKICNPKSNTCNIQEIAIENNDINLFVVGNDNQLLQDYLKSNHDERCNMNNVQSVHLVPNGKTCNPGIQPPTKRQCLNKSPQNTKG